MTMEFQRPECRNLKKAGAGHQTVKQKGCERKQEGTKRVAEETLEGETAGGEGKRTEAGKVVPIGQRGTTRPARHKAISSKHPQR